MMCGRFEIHSAIGLIGTIFGISPEDVTIQYKANYNAAPTDDVIVIIGNGRKRLAQFRWGFIPSWAREQKAGFSMINARAETVAEKPAFREAFRKQRCLVVADGFYEWQKAGKARKPFYVHLKSGKPMAVAGLYSTWASPQDEKINTCTIIVSDAKRSSCSDSRSNAGDIKARPGQMARPGSRTLRTPGLIKTLSFSGTGPIRGISQSQFRKKQQS